MRVWVTDGVNGRQENIVHALIGKLCHVAVNQLDRIAGFALCVLLGQSNGVLVGRVRQNHIVAEILEERIDQREKLEHDER